MTASFDEAANLVQAALIEAINIDAGATLSIVTSAFVSITLETIRRRGFEPDGEVKIDGGKERDITIHAPKKVEVQDEA